MIVLDDLNEKEMNDRSVQAIFKHSRHSNTSTFPISQDYYELTKTTITAKSKIYHIFKTNNFRDVQYLYQDQARMDKKLNELELLTSTSSKGKYQALTIDMTKIKNTSRYRLELLSIFVPNT